MSAASNSEEVELKFSFTDTHALTRLLDETFPPGHGAGWRTIEISDRYFDTPDLALSAAGYGARLRTIGPETLITIKADIEVSDGLHRRLELEAPATRTLDPRKWPHSEARSRLLDVVGQRRLIERFVVGQQRRERAVDLDGARISLSIDDGEVEYLGVPVGELRQFEAEIVDGDAAVLRPLAERLLATGMVVAQDASKLAVAAEMVEQHARVALGDSWSDAARKLLRRHLVRMLDRERPTRDGDSLALKQMRVATRRMRATWRVFDGAFAGAHARHFEDGLRHAAGLLGAVRDLDVLLESVAQRDDLPALAATWRERRDAAFEKLVAHLDSRAYERFVDAFLDGTGARAHWAAGKRAGEHVADLAPGRLESAHAKMLDAATRASDSNEAAAWHALRITAKRMRYALEAFRDVLDERSATDFIEALRMLQDNLGEMNDGSVAAAEAAAWLTSATGADAPPAERVAVARFIAAAEETVAKARTDFAHVWPHVAKAAVPQLGAPR